MARTDSLDNFLADVATAIKTKKSSQVDIPAADFDIEILALPSQGVYETRTINITQNGSQTITPDTGYDAIDEITINTNVPEKQLQTGSYSFTANTTIQLVPEQGYDGFDQVNLSINVAETDLSPELNTQDLDLANMRLAINNRGQERLNIFAQLEEPVVAKGIWLQTDKQVDNIIQDENVFNSGQWNYDKMSEIQPMPYWDQYYLGAAIVGDCVYWWGNNSERKWW